MQLANGVILFIQARRWAGAAKLVEVGDDTTFSIGDIVFRIDVEHTRGFIPFPVGIASCWCVLDAVDVKSFGTHILDGCAQHPAVTTSRGALSLVHQVAKGRQPQLVAVLLNRARGFEVATGVLFAVVVAWAVIANVSQYARGAVTGLNPRIKERVVGQRACGRSWRRLGADVGTNKALRSRADVGAPKADVATSKNARRGHASPICPASKENLLNAR